MSAITVARLDHLRTEVTLRADTDAYLDALGKAPRAVVVAHVVGVAVRLLVVAARTAVLGVR